ncbi:MAG TPA: hypothetical protein VMB03_29300 [Bryobacteraceae bacterium]|nr:hypothetical protein [Bryobacteraceae bacterium]
MRFRTLFAAAIGAAAALFAQTYSPSLYSGLRWRQVGPFRAGRISAVAVIPGDPATYYIGTPGGGIWKSTSGGTTWKAIFDETHQESIGSIAIARSNPDIVYAGTGDVSSVEKSMNIGNGVWKSVDAGANWTHVGLDDTNHVVSLVVDPKNPDLVLAAALGHTYARNEERGVFRSADGGKTWTKVLYKGDNIGAVNMVSDPDNPRTIFAGLEVYLTTPNGRGGGVGIGGRGESERATAGAGIYKSTDEGLTWIYLGGHGLPEGNMGRIGLAVAAGTAGQRVFAVMNGGMYRSDDGGANWHKATDDPRSSGSSYFSQVYVAPDNPDVVYMMQSSIYRSTDGGKTFESFKGAPGGDDYHVLWIDSANSKRMIAGVDQGPTISLDGGHTWDLNWYNLPNGQFYHISTDNRFPFWIYGTQQDSGSAGTSSRGAFGQITFMDWLPSVGAYEFGYVNASPLDPNILMASGQGSNLQRSNLATRQILNVSPPRSLHARFAPYPPHCFSLADPHIYYYGAQFLLETRDLGDTWKVVSPNVTLAPGEAPPPEPAEPASATRGGRGAPVAGISAIGPSPLRAGAVWVGTSNGHIRRTVDGTKWEYVTPSDLPANSQIQQIEASPHNIDTAYFTIDRHSSNDFTPYIFRTRDGGKTWTKITEGIPNTEIARVVKEDPVRAGLLYSGTEHGAWVSFDDGGHWQSLQLNLPTVSVRDLIVHGDDLVIGTYGRAFWVLDDVTPLRQITSEVSNANAYLYKPAPTIRVRNDTDFDTPFPPEITHGDNPPDGAILNYYLKSAPSGPLTIGIYDSAGKLVRELTSVPPLPEPEPQLNVPNYWIERPHPLTAVAGGNRAVWDLRYSRPAPIGPYGTGAYPISALYGATPPEPRGPLVAPGTFEARLTVDGRTYRQTFEVKMDPRIKTSADGIVAQRDMALKILDAMAVAYAANEQVAGVRAALAKAGDAEAVKTLAGKAAGFGGPPAGRGGRGGGFGRGGNAPTNNFTTIHSTFGSQMTTLENADDPPTIAMRENLEDACKSLTTALTKWEELKKSELPPLGIPAPPALAAPAGCSP